jgi:endoglucanase
MNKQKKRILIIAITSMLCIVANIAFTQSLPGYFGVNLAGGEFGSAKGRYNKDYAYPTAAEFAYYKAQGLRLIRLPLKWERLQPVLGKGLDSIELSRVMAVIDEADKEGLLIIPDIHNYGRRSIEGNGYLIGTPEVPVDDIKYFWAEFAYALKEKKNIWAYGLMNEPHDMLSSMPWFNIAQEIINGIREKDSQTHILVAGDHWSSAHRWLDASDNLKNLKDPSGKLIFEAHVYFDNDNSGIYRASYDVEKTTRNTAVERVKPFAGWLKKNNLKGFLGEYGIPGNDARWLAALNNLLKYMKKNRINGTYWAAGPIWKDYPLSVEPENGKDRPQMKILKKYLTLDKK